MQTGGGGKGGGWTTYHSLQKRKVICSWTLDGAWESVDGTGEADMLAVVSACAVLQEGLISLSWMLLVVQQIVAFVTDCSRCVVCEGEKKVLRRSHE